ncbi:MAG: AmmeMemoRadiSam system radical SAM enzyme [Acidobacteria bacterium]|jgi:pyruvate formate lyase activating enzyme|nr:AmmeMemoRadiSam system radical SAM enzyme [Acidobacteriota bacterium]
MSRREAMLWEPAGDGRAACRLCAHRCVVAPGGRGVCAVRENRDGRLETLVYGEAVAAHVDPIEKKPLYHFLPGSKALSVAAAGCNFRCGFCQNWQISQAPRREGGAVAGDPFPPEAVVRAALDNGCRSVSYTYTEPTVFFEYAYDTARLARAAGLLNNFVTNGYLTPEALETVAPVLDAANVDLKAFRDETYRKVCGARLGPVLETIRLMRKLGVWVEVTTLVVPGLNDGTDELASIAAFIASVDPETPWHISRYHPDFEYDQAPPTPPATLRAAAAIGRREGLKHIYVGNVPGEGEDTLCASCGAVLIRRRGFAVVANALRGSLCPKCGTVLAGRFA